MVDSRTDQIIEEIRSSKHINIGEGFEYAKYCSSLLKGNLDDNECGRKIIVNILDNWKKIDANLYEIWADLVESAGFYPYIEKEKKNLKLNNTSGEIRKELHKSKNLDDTYLHEEQNLLVQLVDTGKNLILSAPTSFGKSLIIEEIVASKKYKNIVVIQPTLALLDETRKKLKKYSNNYKIIVRTSQLPATDKGNLFLLTAERVMEYQNLPTISLLIIDEFYKLSEKRPDERSDVLNNAFHLLLKRDNVKFYLLGPNIKGISPGFAEKYGAIFYETTYSLVDKMIIDLSSDEFGKRGNKKSNKEKALFDLLLKLKNDQNIIYCSSPYRARYLSRKFLNYLTITNQLSEIEQHLPLIDWITENVSKYWSLNQCLEKSIAFHDGALQRHITSAIIKYFNNNNIKYLFCTSTIIEGVNTSAKNVIYFDEEKGGIKIDFFDFSNIKGRAGRMMIHYVGRVYTFNSLPEEKDLIVDIPFFEQNPIKDEVLIHLSDDEVKNKDSEQYKELMEIHPKERELFKKNGLSIKGQKKILDFLYQNINNNIKINGNRYSLIELVNWHVPNYDQLQFMLDLCWDNFKIEKESLSIHSASQLTQRVMSYTISKNIRVMLLSTLENYREARTSQTEGWHSKYKGMSDEDILEEATRDTFQVLKHWFQYKVPKWLRVMNELVKFVCNNLQKPRGDYTSFANQLENDFVRQNLSILVEYGVPRSAVEKIKSQIDSTLSEDEVIMVIKEKRLYEHNELLPYEKEKIIDSI